jgi:hypothetical protein
MANTDALQAPTAADELDSHTRKSLALLSHDKLLEAAVALATRCRALEELLAGEPYIYTLPDELLLSRILLALPLLSRLRCCAVSRRFKRLLFTPALRDELRIALDPAHVLLSGRFRATDESVWSPDCRFLLSYQGDANLVLYYYRTMAHDGHPVWALQTVACPYQHYAPGRLGLSRDGVVSVLDRCGHRYWQSPKPGGTPPYRLVVRNEGDFAVLDCNDDVVWAAVVHARPWEAP